MASKTFHIAPADMKPLALGRGACIASDRIVVDGKPVGYMYREAPANPHDSGWRFLAGDEDEAYMAVSSHHSVYAVNTVANYSPTILAVLDAPEGSAFERTADGAYQPAR